MCDWRKRTALANPPQTKLRGFAEHAPIDLEALEARRPHAEVNAAVREKIQNDFITYDLARRERQRQRLITSSRAGLLEHEVLELILINAIQEFDVASLAQTLLDKFGDLNSVLVAPASRLMRVPGVTEHCVVQFRLAHVVAVGMARAKVMNRPLLSSWNDLMLYCKTAMAHRETEQFRLLFLNAKLVLVADEEQANGTIDHVPVYPREVVKRALELNAAAIILIHNHPSGDPTPSYSDIEMTHRIEAACDAVGVIVHDHVIIGRDSDSSFRALGLM